MSKSMVEKVTAVLMSSVNAPERQIYAAARAVIAAMREPSAAMVDAGVKHENWSSYKSVRDIYGAMIDAALQEPKP